MRAEDMVNSAVSVLPDGAGAQRDLQFAWSEGWLGGPPLCPSGVHPAALGMGQGERRAVGIESRVNALLDPL